MATYFKIVPIELTQLKFQNLSIISLLKEGCYGQTYRAKCDQLPCVAKCMKFNRTAEDVAIRLLMVCQLVSSLKHPNIIQCLGTVRQGFTNCPILLLELLDESLSHFLERFEKMSLAVPHHIKVNLCHDVALGLDYLHTNKIIHANLTSNNVLIVGESRAKVTDFWMLSLEEASAEIKIIRDTQDIDKQVYMAPEVKISRRYVPKSDTYSFGVLAVQIDAQCHFEPDDELKRLVIATVNKSVVELPSQGRFMQLGHKCLAKESSMRPGMEDLCKDLAQLKASEDYLRSIEWSRQALATAARQDVVKSMEQKLLEISMENDRLAKRNADLELLQQRLLSGNFFIRSTTPAAGGQDEPDSSTDLISDNSMSDDKIHSQDQRFGVVIPIGEIVMTSALLGRGKTSEVYAATWMSSEVAIKRYKITGDAENWIAKMKHEVKELSQLRHPRIMAVHGLTLDDSFAGLVMERLFCSLHTALFSVQKSLSETKRRRLVRQISEGLEFLHGRQVVHGHLTSKNILLDEQYHAKIGGHGPKFVRSKYLYIHDLVGEVDPIYTAPEILLHKPLSAKQLKKVDVYSLAVVSYEIMESIEAYKELPSQLLYASSRPSDKSTSANIGNMSRPVLDAVTKCCHKDPSARPTCAEFLKEWKKLENS